MARGSITKRGSSWTAVVDLPPVLDPATGKLKRKQKRLTAPTKRELEALVAKQITATQQGIPEASRATVAELLDYWLSTMKSSLKPGTYRRYQELIRLHLKPTIGSIRLARLTPAHIQALYSNRSTEGNLSNTTIQHLHGVLHHALEDAVKWELVHRNVSEVVEPPKRDTPEMTVWSVEEARQFLRSIRDDELEALWTLALLTGLRRGELLGLKWADIDLDAHTLSVRRTISRGADGKYAESTPKTKFSSRRVALPPSATECLRRHKAAQNAYRLQIGPVWQQLDYVFTSPTGTALHPNTMAKAFKRAVKKAGVPEIRFHDLRHTSATLLLSQGVHPKIVQERLGHTTIAMTMDRYSHVTKDMQEAAAMALETVISGAKSDAS